MTPIRYPGPIEVWEQWRGTHPGWDTDTPMPPSRVLLNGEPLKKCVSFNEAIGTAEVWVTDENGKTILFREDDPPGPRKRTVTGDIRLETDPDTRAWFEQHYPAERAK